MLQRGQGIIVNVASNAALQPLPFMATYGTTKAFVLSFTKALWGENRGGPVRVLAVRPGPTETLFFEVVGTEHGESKKKRTAHQLVTPWNPHSPSAQSRTRVRHAADACISSGSGLSHRALHCMGCSWVVNAYRVSSAPARTV
jgi:short-subunit dehydrogenase